MFVEELEVEVIEPLASPEEIAQHWADLEASWTLRPGECDY